LSWLSPLLSGIFFGFLMSILLGAIFFMLIQAGLRYNYKKGILIASGVICGDAIFIFLAIYFTDNISEFIIKNESSINILGGIVFLLIGGFTLIKKRDENMDSEMDVIKTSRNARDFFIKPFVINILNPANALWWLGLFSTVGQNYDISQKIVFSIGALASIFTTEVGISFSASKLKKYINSRTLKAIDLVAGSVLIISGLKMIIFN
jgi:threonine/homoserine/homoserine lactone efflux protein